jgi:hypothetical protein
MGRVKTFSAVNPPSSVTVTVTVMDVPEAEGRQGGDVQDTWLVLSASVCCPRVPMLEVHVKWSCWVSASSAVTLKVTLWGPRTLAEDWLLSVKVGGVLSGLQLAGWFLQKASPSAPKSAHPSALASRSPAANRTAWMLHR